ncbi:hypothetical protein B9L19_01990 [Geobacillus thermocatenulatus]|uniref:Uncharacterized protein n=1 Tax=Geobacillus thermocatenulatus TaxID=33938 RepID=A0A226Q941_9BACL|nr:MULTISPECIES: hypothetical protein [Geobacillus]AST00657.1 hypothetical protein GT3921_17580 [Geobacillus thermocatenulatus]KLR75119.1 hypothetical protein ABH20_01980 [Geobacillus sp. T6]OXB88895.1 hypothetical protein B9L19_01990 [Geobacillus thermocatenulatus]
MLNLIYKIANAIIKYGGKAIQAIKNVLGSLYDSFIAAYKKGFAALVEWFLDHSWIVQAIYEALKAAGLID